MFIYLSVGNLTNRDRLTFATASASASTCVIMIMLKRERPEPSHVETSQN